MDQLQTHTPLTFYQMGIGKDSRRTSQHTFVVNKRQPIGPYVVIAQCVHRRDVQQWRNSIVLSWWEGLGADLMLVINIQKARDDLGGAMQRRGLSWIMFATKRRG